MSSTLEVCVSSSTENNAWDKKFGQGASSIHQYNNILTFWLIFLMCVLVTFLAWLYERKSLTIRVLIAQSLAIHCRNCFCWNPLASKKINFSIVNTFLKAVAVIRICQIFYFLKIFQFWFSSIFLLYTQQTQKRKNCRHVWVLYS